MYIYPYIYIYIYIYTYINVYINFKAINNVSDGKMVLKTHFSLKCFAYFTEASSVYILSIKRTRKFVKQTLCFLFFVTLSQHMHTL